MSRSSRQGSLRSSAAGAGSASRPASRPAGRPVDAEQVAALLEPVASALGMDLEGIRVTSAGRRRVLRIVLDADGGVSLDDIAVVSRDLSAALDDSAVMGDQPYTLEVSSPGVDRPLTERRHWRRAIGRLVVAPLIAAGNGEERATVEGRITGASADGITLDTGGESRIFGYSDLGPGKIKIEFAPIDAVPGDAGGSGGSSSPSRGRKQSTDPDDEGADEEGSDGY
ncbi:MAG: ribosome maturation factor RimP [Streptosporangiaceae bacterium]